MPFQVLFYILISTIFFQTGILYGESTAATIEFRFIDVGEGAATLVRSNEVGNILIDTGNPNSKIASYLKAQKISKIDHLFITHPHPDHMGGVFAVRETIPVKNIYDNGEPLGIIAAEQDIFRFYSDAVRKDPNYRLIKKGFTLSNGDFLLETVSPVELSSDWNTNSLIIRITYRNFSALLMADGNIATEKYLLASKTDLSAQVLQVGHHGAADATTEAFLKAVRPKVSIISVNRNNIRGYPALDTIAKLKDAGTKILRTDLNGTITILARKDGTFTISESK